MAQQRKTIKKKKDNLPIEWKKIFANKVTGKALISKISKLVQKLWETWRFLKETKKQSYHMIHQSHFWALSGKDEN